MQNQGSHKASTEEGKKSTGGQSKSSGVATELQQLFEDELKDIYWAEQALVKAIPKMISNASDSQLIAALEDHLAVTKNHVLRAEQVFKSIGVTAEAVKCEAMTGLLKEAEEIMQEASKGFVRDAGIISAAQKVEHYEIATYGTLRTFASTLGHTEAASLLEKTLEEEKEADSNLTKIAESSINQDAVAGKQKH